LSAALGARSVDEASAPAERLLALERNLEELRRAVGEQEQSLRTAARDDRLSMVVFSGSLDRLIAAFVIATGAAAMGMQVNLFFTFWGTAALRRENVHVKKSLLGRMLGWMLPSGSKELPLSQMNMAGMGPVMIRRIMKTKGVASLEEMITLAGELGVRIAVCTMSMDLLGMREEEMIEYPDLFYCGVAKFLETSTSGKVTLFL
jgi:peroxiredoxin family protein